MLAENIDCALAGLQEKRLAFRKLTLESTLPPHSDGAARRVDPEKGRAPRLWSEFCIRGFPSSTQDACGLRGSSGRIQRANV